MKELMNNPYAWLFLSLNTIFSGLNIFFIATVFLVKRRKLKVKYEN